MYTEHPPHALVTDCREKCPYENMWYVIVTGLLVEAVLEQYYRARLGKSMLESIASVNSQFICDSFFISVKWVY